MPVDYSSLPTTCNEMLINLLWDEPKAGILYNNYHEKHHFTRHRKKQTVELQQLARVNFWG
jgi:hypothetical protein